MRVIERVEPVEELYLLKCRFCGSTLEVSKEDFLHEYDRWFKCPVCGKCNKVTDLELKQASYDYKRYIKEIEQPKVNDIDW